MFTVYIGSASSLTFLIFITSIPYLCVGTLFRSRTLFGPLSFTSHEVDAFIGMFTFGGSCAFPRVSSFSSLVTGPRLASSLSSVVFELISMIEGRSSFSKSNAISGALSSVFFVAFRLTTGCDSLSLELVVSASFAFLLVFLLSNFFYCSSVAAVTSLFEYTFGVLVFPGIMVNVCADSLTTFPLFFLKVPSSFEPRALSLTRIDESRSSWKSEGLKSKLGSCSEISNNPFTRFDFTVLGFRPICFSNGELPSFSLFTLSEYRISDRPDLSFVKIICLFVRNRSFIVLIKRSIFPFPLWSRTGHTHYHRYSKIMFP